jgi:hypothetical protein
LIRASGGEKKMAVSSTAMTYCGAWKSGPNHT